jgi:prevent-host-death family protein
MITVTSVEAQNRFGQLLDTVQREPVSVTRHVRPAAFIVSSEVYQALTGGVAAHTEKMAAYLQSIQAFRGQGKGGAAARLVTERRADAARNK